MNEIAQHGHTELSLLTGDITRRAKLGWLELRRREK